MHEMAGHAFQELTIPSYNSSAKIKNDNNIVVEKLHERIFKAFKISGSIWYKNKKVDEHPRFR
jgi:hypothetical protein